MTRPRAIDEIDPETRRLVNELFVRNEDRDFQSDPPFTKEHQDYLDRWYGDRPARVMPGHHVCSVCGEDIDFPGECMSCQTFIEYPMPGYEDWDRTVGF